MVAVASQDPSYIGVRSGCRASRLDASRTTNRVCVTKKKKEEKKEREERKKLKQNTPIFHCPPTPPLPPPRCLHSMTSPLFQHLSTSPAIHLITTAGPNFLSSYNTSGGSNFYSPRHSAALLRQNLSQQMPRILGLRLLG